VALGLALDARSDYEQTRDTYPGSPEEIADAQERGERMALVTDAMFGVTGAAAVGTLITYFLIRPDEGTEDAEHALATVGVSPRAVTLRVAF
jgi:hypothetical protein